MKKRLFLSIFILQCILIMSTGVPSQAAPVPFASNLFQGNFSNVQKNEASVLEPGDRVVLRLWGGSVSFDGSLVVSADGKLASTPEGNLPSELENMPVSGLPHDKLADALKSRLSARGVSDTQIYVAPLDGRPVAVFITGGVQKPGRYSGLPSDSILTLLDKAGGIDPKRGSYRSIRLLRDENEVASFDLYPFARTGAIKWTRLHDNDTLVVSERGPVVEAGGEARNSAFFEFRKGEATGKALLDLAEPYKKASHVSLSGTRNGAPYNTYLPISSFAGLTLEDGDRVTFMADAPGNTIMVQVSGAVRGASNFPVRRGAKLSDVRRYIAVEPGRANLEAIYIKRKSVAERQKKALDDALRRLEQSAFTATSSSTEESQIRANEANMLSKFVERAKAVEPEGVVVVGKSDLALENGDVIVVPEKSDVVLVSGEVLVPQAMVWNKKKDFDDYVKGAGGYSNRADKSVSLIVRQNGEVLRSNDGDIMPGDQLLIMPKVESKSMQTVKDVAQVLFQVAVSARMVLGLP